MEKMTVYGKRIEEFVRSAGVGIAATLMDLLSLFVLVQCLHLKPEYANVPALLLGLAIQFLGNKHFAFRDRSRDYLKQGALFTLIEAGAFLLNASGFHLAVHDLHINYLVSRMMTSFLVYICFSFPLWSLIFKRSPCKTAMEDMKTIVLKGA